MDKVVAIDGPSGSGKSTIAQLFAKKHNLLYIDTGAMFRAIAFVLDQDKISPDDVVRIEERLDQMNFEYGASDEKLVMIDNENLTLKIREHQVSKLASIYSQVSSVRSYLKKCQRDIAKKSSSLLEGRDIGTVIFPKAAVKFFLTANNEVRAQRRLEQLKKLDSTKDYSLEQISKDIAKRDHSDQSRSLAPLLKAQDAIEIDTSNSTIDEVLGQMSEHFLAKKGLFS